MLLSSPRVLGESGPESWVGGSPTSRPRGTTVMEEPDPRPGTQDHQGQG